MSQNKLYFTVKPKYGQEQFGRIDFIYGLNRQFAVISINHILMQVIFWAPTQN